MTKQKEIREGLIKRLNEFRWELQKPNAIIDIHTLTMLQGSFADQILKDEDSQGVVIKVDRELPDNPALQNTPYDWRAGYNQAQQDMAGYVAVEPLIDE